MLIIKSSCPRFQGQRKLYGTAMPTPGNLKQDNTADYQLKSVMFPWFPRTGRTAPVCTVYDTAMPTPGSLKQDSNADYQLKSVMLPWFPRPEKAAPQRVQYTTQPCQRQAT